MSQKIKVIRSLPYEGAYFTESTVKIGNMPEGTEHGIVNIFDDVRRQEMLGFGGAFTESAAYNYSLMDSATKKAFMKAYFSRKEGIGYNFGRTHIHSCDFSIDLYTYVKEGDMTLESFDISRDKKYIIPMLKDAMQYCEDEIYLFASPWTPPAYMKDNNSMIGGGKLLEEYRALWALYYAKYIKAYAAEGIKISAISVQNEPIALQTWESCYYSPDDEKEMLEKYLIPTLEREGLPDVKVVLWDHNKERVFDRARYILKSPVIDRKTLAVGHHWYSGDHFDGMSLVWEELGKPTVSTEFCKEMKNNNGGIGFAEDYAREISGDLNNYNIAICDWNLMLDQNGGPFHNRTAQSSHLTGAAFDITQGGCYAPILFDTESGKMTLTPVYYYIGHFSKFIKRGAHRIGCTKHTERLSVSAFRNPDGERVVVVMNPTDELIPVVLRHNDVCTRIDAAPHSIMTLVF